MSSYLQHPWIKLGMAVCTNSPRSTEAKTGGWAVELTDQLASLGELMNSQVLSKERSCPQNKMERDGGYPVSTPDLHMIACTTYV